MNRGDIIYCKDLLSSIKIRKRPCIVIDVFLNKVKVLYITHNNNQWDYVKEQLYSKDVDTTNSFAILNIFEPECSSCNESNFKSKVTERLLDKLKQLGFYGDM